MHNNDPTEGIRYLEQGEAALKQAHDIEDPDQREEKLLQCEKLFTLSLDRYKGNKALYSLGIQCILQQGLTCKYLMDLAETKDTKTFYKNKALQNLTQINFTQKSKPYYQFDVQKRIGDIKLLEEKYYEALSIYQECIKQCPEDDQLIFPKIYASIGYTYYRLENFQEASKYLDKFLNSRLSKNQKFARKLEAVRKLQVNILLEQRRFQETIPILLSLTLSITNEELYHCYQSLGSAYLHDKQIDKAKEYFEKVLKEYPDDPCALNGLGQCLLTNGQLDQAQQRFQKAQESDPTYAYAYQGLGSVHMEKGDKQNAMDMMKKAINIDKSYALAYHKMGDILKDDNPQEAKKLFNKAGELYGKQHEFDSSIKVLEQTSGLGDSNHEGQIIKAKILINQNLLEPAQRISDELEKELKNISILLLGEFYDMKGQLCLQQADQNNEKNKNQLLLEARKNFKEGLQYKQEKNPETLLRIGEISVRLGDKQEADKYYSMAIERFNQLKRQPDSYDQHHEKMRLMAEASKAINQVGISLSQADGDSEKTLKVAVEQLKSTLRGQDGQTLPPNLQAIAQKLLDASSKNSQLSKDDQKQRIFTEIHEKLQDQWSQVGSQTPTTRFDQSNLFESEGQKQLQLAMSKIKELEQINKNLGHNKKNDCLKKLKKFSVEQKGYYHTFFWAARNKFESMAIAEQGDFEQVKREQSVLEQGVKGFFALASRLPVIGEAVGLVSQVAFAFSDTYLDQKYENQRTNFKNCLNQFREECYDSTLFELQIMQAAVQIVDNEKFKQLMILLQELQEKEESYAAVFADYFVAFSSNESLTNFAQKLATSKNQTKTLTRGVKSEDFQQAVQSQIFDKVASKLVVQQVEVIKNYYQERALLHISQVFDGMVVQWAQAYNLEEETPSGDKSQKPSNEKEASPTIQKVDKTTRLDNSTPNCNENEKLIPVSQVAPLPPDQGKDLVDESIRLQEEEDEDKLCKLIVDQTLRIITEEVTEINKIKDRIKKRAEVDTTKKGCLAYLCCKASTQQKYDDQVRKMDDIESTQNVKP